MDFPAIDVPTTSTVWLPFVTAPGMQMQPVGLAIENRPVHGSGNAQLDRIEVPTATDRHAVELGRSRGVV